MQHDHGMEAASSASFGDFVSRLFDTDFMKRGECIAWRPEVLWLHVISDAAIALAYYSIPIALLYYILKRRDQKFNWMFVMFALFILACGTTHVMGILAIWYPMYRLDGVIKLITAILSIATAVTLWPLIPKALAIPSPAQLENANEDLRQAQRELESRVQERTSELQTINSKYAVELAERRRIEATLRASEQRFRVALQSAPITIFNQDADLRYTWINDPQRGMRSPHVVGRHDADLFPPETAARLTEIKSRVIATGTGEHAEVPIPVDGEIRHFDFRAEPLRDDAGIVTGLTGVKVDITERKRAEQHRAFLLAELDHRVKNNLSVVLALAEESMRASESMDDFNRSFTGRVRSLAKTHAALAAASWEGVRLDALIKLTMESYTPASGTNGAAHSRVSITGDPVHLSPKAAAALCMTINELVTNAAKYGAFSNATGRVDIRWHFVANGSEVPTLRLEWTETGGPPVKPPTRRGLGMQLIEEGVAYEMGGMVRTEYRPEGVRCTVEFPYNEQNSRRGRFEPATARNGGPA